MRPFMPRHSPVSSASLSRFPGRGCHPAPTFAGEIESQLAANAGTRPGDPGRAILKVLPGRAPRCFPCCSQSPTGGGSRLKKELYPLSRRCLLDRSLRDPVVFHRRQSHGKSGWITPFRALKAAATVLRQSGSRFMELMIRSKYLLLPQFRKRTTGSHLSWQLALVQRILTFASHLTSRVHCECQIQSSTRILLCLLVLL